MADNDAQKTKAAPNLSELATTGDGRDITRPFTQGIEGYRDEIVKYKGGGNLKVFTEVLRDDQVKSTFEQRIKSVTSQKLTVSPGGDKPIDQQAADYLAEQLKKVGFDKAANKMLYGNFYGYAVAEIMWAIEGGKVAIHKIKVRDRERFRFDVEGNLRLLTMDNPVMGEQQPDRKYWVYAAGATHDDEPYGMGLAHWLYWPVFFKRGGMRRWLKFLDKFSAPTKVGRYHPNASGSDVGKLLAALSAMEVDSGIAIPDGMAIELLEAKRSGTADYDKLYERMDKAIAKVVLSQTMTTDDGSSLSQAEVHEGVRDDVTEGDGDLLCCSFKEGPAHWLTEWNFPGAAIPEVAFMDEDEEDLNTAAERDIKLKGLGWQLTDKAFTEKYGEGYERIKATPGKTGSLNKEPGSDEESGEEETDKEETDKEETGDFADQDPDVISGLGEEAVARSVKAFRKEFLDPVVALAEASDGFDDFISKLDSLMSEPDPDTVEFAAQAFFMARAGGLTGLSDEDETGGIS